MVVLISLFWGLVMTSPLFGLPVVCDERQPGSLIIGATADCGDGIIFASAEIQALFASQLPVGGPVDLQGGTLTLATDMRCTEGIQFPTNGSVIGQGNTLSLPFQDEPIAFSAAGCLSTIHSSVVCENTPPIAVCAWQPSVADGVIALATDEEEALFSVGQFQQASFTTFAQTRLSGRATAIAWAPHIAAGIVGLRQTTQGSAVYFSYDRINRAIRCSVLTECTGQVGAIAWQSDGSRAAIAVSEPQGARILIYRRQQDGLAFESQSTMVGVPRVLALAWNESGERLMVGFEYAANQPQLILYQVADGLFTKVAATHFDAHVSCIESVSGENSMFFVGLIGGGSTHRLRVYKEQEAGFYEQARYSVAFDVYGMQWIADAQRLAVLGCSMASAVDGYAKSSVSFYAYQDGGFYRKSLCELPAPQYACTFATDAQRSVALIGIHGALSLASAKGAMQCKDLCLVSGSPVRFPLPLMVDGRCLIDASGRTIECTHPLSIGVDSTLTLRYASFHAADALRIKSAPGSVVQLHSCSFAGLVVDGAGDVWCAKSCLLSGLVQVPRGTVEPDTIIELLGDTVLRGTLNFSGRVEIQGNGKRLDLSRFKGTLALDATVIMRNVDVVGEQLSTWTLDAGAAVIVEKEELSAKDSAPVVPVEQASALIVMTEQGICITSSTHTLHGSMELSAAAPLEVCATTIVNGNGNTIRCGERVGTLMRIAPGVRVELRNVVLEDLFPAAIEVGTGGMLVFGNGVKIKLGRGGCLSTAWRLSSGTVVIEGLDDILTLTDTAGLIIEDGTTCILRHCTLEGVLGRRLDLLGKGSSLLLDSAQVRLAGDSTFLTGSIEVSGTSRIGGPHALYWYSSEQCLIRSGGRLEVGDFCHLYYNPLFPRSDGIACQDATATLALSNCCVETVDKALRMTEGRIELSQIVSLRGHGQGIFFSDQQSAAHANISYNQVYLHVYGGVVF